ncbi:MAG: DUF4435 domain-containing protein [Bacteroidaceae bacterium]|nr:DUF4435 domain-containing protein [Bacteroidaceae bacterium]
MSNRLKDNLNSHYIEAANLLRPKTARKRVVAYVESYDDVAFWRGVLRDFENDQVKFEVMLPSRTSLEKGKKSAMMNDLGPGLGRCMIACVDADYDYVMQGHNEASRRMLDNPYVFHTYAYSIESLMCYHEGLHEVATMATLNDAELFSLSAFMQEYGRTIWPLLVWSVWMYRHEHQHHFTLMGFANLVSFRDVLPSHPERTLEFVRRQVNRQVAQLQKRYPEGKETYIPLRNELLSLGLTPETAYLFMQGHKLMEGVVTPLLLPVCSQLRHQREVEIQQLACHGVQRQNELSSYRHSQLPLEVALKQATAFKDSAIFQRLRADLRRFVDRQSRT